MSMRPLLEKRRIPFQISTAFKDVITYYWQQGKFLPKPRPESEESKK